MNQIFRRITASMPGLGLKLKQAGMHDNAEQFVKKTFISTLYLTLGLALIVWMALTRLKFSPMVYLVVDCTLFLVLFFYFLKVPDAKINGQKRQIDREIVYAGRFLIVELESGISLYNAMINVSKSFDSIGKQFDNIVTRIDLGTSMETALNETIQTTPSQNFSKILWQILNVMRTGADISRSLNNVIEQVVREQIIEVKEYGKRLNPLAMFYMVVAVILPSIGITGLIVVASFMSFTMGLPILLTIVGLLGFIQFMFLAIIKSSRPAIEL